jgi:glyoxylase-like metal-dependent hydrolase (beta-lactamase superfamily II)
MSKGACVTITIPFNRKLEFEYGTVDRLSPLIRRVIARNPSAFTFHGTGTYILGQGNVAIIDPGPDLPEHVAALRNCLQGEEITHLLVTHTHRDHSPACRELQTFCDARTYAYGPHGAGKLERGAGIEVEEGGDRDFVPDVKIKHGDVIEGDGWSVECVYTPGHTSNHICFQLREEKILFSGDHVMGWSTSVISPPDGDMGDYMHSLELLLERDDAAYWPTHGPRIDDPKPYVRAFIQHRREREQQILDCLGRGIDTIAAMVPQMYRDIPQGLYPAAARSVFAAIIYLCERGEIGCAADIALDARYFKK